MFFSRKYSSEMPKSGMYMRDNYGLRDDKWILGEVPVNFLCWIISSTGCGISEGNPDSNLDLKADLRTEQRNLSPKKFQC